MDKIKNDATSSKLGDIYQYYIALKDCFKMNKGDRLQIEALGDVTVISDLKNFCFQKEVKHHINSKNFSNQDIEFWKTLYNWYIEYEKIKNFDSLILYTTSIISTKSKFYNWNNLSPENKLNVLKEIKSISKIKNIKFMEYYQAIFDLNYNKDKLLKILEKLKLEHSQNNMKKIMKELEPYIRYIPEKIDKYLLMHS